MPIDMAITGNRQERLRAASLMKRHKFPIVKSHWLTSDFNNLREKSPDLAESLDSSAGKIYVIRHPREVLASAFLFESSYSDQVSERQAWLNNQSKYWSRHVESWTSREDVFVIRFKDILADPKSCVLAVAERFGLQAMLAHPVLPPRLKSKWIGRLNRLRTNSPSTEILIPNQGESFDALFEGLDLAPFNDAVALLIERFGLSN